MCDLFMLLARDERLPSIDAYMTLKQNIAAVSSYRPQGKVIFS